MRISSLTPLIIAVTTALAACQSTPRGGGGGASGGSAGGGPGAAYNPANQPAVNPLASQGAPAAGGRVQRSEGGANAGAYQATPPEGVRGSGSAFNPHELAQEKKKQFEKKAKTP
jgi:hypothetical protein